MNRQGFFALIFIAAGAASLSADSVAFRSGKKTEGALLGAYARQIDFLTSAGESHRVPIEDVVSLTFSSPTTKPTQETRAADMVPAGTLLRVRAIGEIDIDTSQAGMTFCGSLDDPIVSGGSVIVSRGADVVLIASQVEQEGNFKGSDLIQLEAISVVVNGKPHLKIPAETRIDFQLLADWKVR